MKNKKSGNYATEPTKIIPREKLKYNVKEIGNE